MFMGRGNHMCKDPEVPESLHMKGAKNISLQLEHNKPWGKRRRWKSVEDM